VYKVVPCMMWLKYVCSCALFEYLLELKVSLVYITKLIREDSRSVRKLEFPTIGLS
jgi:hypothetical protein